MSWKVAEPIFDTGEACAAVDIDLSPGAFEKMENLNKRRVDVTWEWIMPVPEGV